jgi:hypothetical protein
MPGALMPLEMKVRAALPDLGEIVRWGCRLFGPRPTRVPDAEEASPGGTAVAREGSGSTRRRQAAGPEPKGPVRERDARARDRQGSTRRPPAPGPEGQGSRHPRDAWSPARREGAALQGAGGPAWDVRARVRAEPVRRRRGPGRPSIERRSSASACGTSSRRSSMPWPGTRRRRACRSSTSRSRTLEEFT